MLGNKGKISSCSIVVIAIIVLGTGVVLAPIFMGPKRYPPGSGCANNMKQLFLGLQSYAADNGNLLPPAVDNGGKIDLDNPKNTWHGKILRYIKSDKLFLCPSVHDNELRWANWKSLVQDKYGKNVIPCSYGMNIRFSTGGSRCVLPENLRGTIPIKPMSLSSPKQPSKTVLLVETQAELRWTGDEGEQPFPLPNSRTTYKVPPAMAVAPYGDWGDHFFGMRWFDEPYAPTGHTGIGMHVVCADGHVKFIKRPMHNPATEASGAIRKANTTWWEPLE